MLEKLEEQLKLAEEYGFDEVWIRMTLNEAGVYLHTIRTFKRTGELPIGLQGHSNKEN